MCGSRNGVRRAGMTARPGAWARWIVRVGMPVACASSLAAQRPPVGAAVGAAVVGAAVVVASTSCATAAASSLSHVNDPSFSNTNTCRCSFLLLTFSDGSTSGDSHVRSSRPKPPRPSG